MNSGNLLGAYMSEDSPVQPLSGWFKRSREGKGKAGHRRWYQIHGRILSSYKKQVQVLFALGAVMYGVCKLNNDFACVLEYGVLCLLFLCICVYDC